MSLKTFAEHTLETSLLKHGCVVLDVGCRGFGFGNALRREFKANVCEVDIDYLPDAPPYLRLGIAGAYGFGSVSDHNDPDSRSLIPGNKVQVFTLETFSKVVNVPHWDVIKLDCEGSEYDILWNLKAPPATQITVEFHQHTAARRSEEFMADLIKKLQQWYQVSRHRLYGRPGCLNYWDSLFVLR